jgi:hypothetical protein
VRAALALAALALLLVPSASPAPPAWAYVLATPPPGPAAAPVVTGTGTWVHWVNADGVQYVAHDTVPATDVEVRFLRVSAQPACNSPAYAAHLTVQFAATAKAGQPNLEGTADIVWGGQRLGDPTAEGDDGFTPIAPTTAAVVHFQDAARTQSAVAHTARVQVALYGPTSTAATGGVTSVGLRLTIDWAGTTQDPTEAFHWSGTGPADVFGQLLQPPGPCLSGLP